MFIIIGKFEEEAKNNSLLTGCSHKNDTTKIDLISQKVKVTVNWHNIEAKELQLMNFRLKTLLKDTYLPYFLIINVQCYTSIKLMETILLKLSIIFNYNIKFIFNLLLKFIVELI